MQFAWYCGDRNILKSVYLTILLPQVQENSIFFHEDILFLRIPFAPLRKFLSLRMKILSTQ